jgi:hypothetical protein
MKYYVQYIVLHVNTVRKECFVNVEKGQVVISDLAGLQGGGGVIV